MRARVRNEWLIVAALACSALGTALAQPHAGPKPSSPTHGAATMQDQLKKLQALGVSTDGSAVPVNVDAAIWHLSIPEDNALDAKRIALGRELYFETALSKDGTVSCSTCHDSTRSFTDRRPVSEGIGGALGRRNAPTTMNAALLHVQFWDGREPTLEEQAGQPILNSVEMGLTTPDEAVAKLKAAGYDAKFRDAYGADVNYGDIQRAIAAFERTLMFLDAPFDRFLNGDESAISADARAGFELFNGKARCVTCHMINRANPLGTDNRFHNIGVAARHQDFEQLALKALEILRHDNSDQMLDELALTSDVTELGRFIVTTSYADVGAFRTSQLRNVAITAPYMHDGSMQTLWDVMDHYNKGGEPNAYLDGGMEALALTEKEIDQVVALMFTLTDVRFDDLNASELERQRDLAKKQRPFRDEALAQRRELDFEKRALGGRTLGGGQ